MGKRGLKKKNEPFIIFPQDRKDLAPVEMEIGKTFRIGQPSNRYYQYIFSSLDFLRQKLSDLSELSGLEGTLVRVTGMINLKGGNRFAVVEHKEGQVFFDHNDRLFVDALKAIQHREVIFEQ